MNPTAFKILGLDIRWYGILIATGILIAFLTASKTCKFRSVSFDDIFDTAFIALPAGIIGARLYYVLFNFSYYRENISQVLNIRQGGLAIHGGIIFGVLAAFIYTKVKKINLMELLDTAAPSIILAQAIGRWGNFMNSEAHGGPVSYEFIKHFPLFIQNGMYIEGTYYHPTFLYESIWNLSIFLILLYILKNRKEKGMVFFSYIGLYSLGRFFIEGLRTDSLMIGPFRIAQLISLSGILIFILYLFVKGNLFIRMGKVKAD
ncbi:MAG: prolipoprotein diacylglyceryl transferase [Bacillota bacterium]|nr:prolipoprotein diacylglyceryl transferase [Bacillota bacterium]